MAIYSVPFLYIRADADSKIGIGHVMRCLALAQAWKKTTGNVIFLGRIDSDDLRQRIKKEGFDLIPVSAPTGTTEDIAEVLNTIQQYSRPERSWLVLDGYDFVKDYQIAMSEAGHRLLVIDDDARHLEYHADILLNQNINSKQLSYSLPRDCKLLLGTRYVLLRNEFLIQRPLERPIAPIAKRILITLGGADPSQATLKSITALGSVKNIDHEIRVLVGPANPHLTAIQTAALDFSGKMTVISNTEKMPDMIAWADLGISAGGSTCWELAFMGLPFVVIVLSDNQARIAQGLHQANVAVSCGEHRNLSIDRLGQEVLSLIQDEKRRKKMSSNGKVLVDGLGPRRVVDEMLGYL
jgi:UDP-2,4-diacetamido-2,4,6-trideoxy-beta-L-altropyranose hydrolase